MKKNYCDFCWAKLSDGKCLCNEEIRPKHCAAAVLRANAKAVDKELVGIREYMLYISKRIAFLKVFGNGERSNEYKYLRHLRKQILQWGKDHLIFYHYLCGKISLERAKTLYGVSEREFYRISARQRKNLITFITEQEEVLSKQYPFYLFDGELGEYE